MAATWKCEVCGYIHKGDSPPDVCPVCGVGAEQFSLFEPATAPASKADTTPSTGVWRCNICGLEHTGDTPPDICPLCGAVSSHFVPKGTPPSSTSAVALKILIVGGGVAAVTAAERAREVSEQADILMITKEGAPYYRLNLTRYLAGEVSREALAMNGDAWFEANRIERLDDEVTHILRTEKTVVTATDRKLPYDKLILAGGAHPFIPPILGAGRDHVLPLRTAAHADAALAAAPKGAKVVIIGGGLLGLEAAGAFQKRGATVTVLEGFSSLLPRQLPARGGALLAAYLEKSGIAVRIGVKTKEIVGDEKARGVLLEGGEEIHADLVILSTGIRANSYLARRSEIKVNNGVLVDDKMTTSDPDVLAAGDVAEHRGVLYGIWPTAYAQGAVAGTVAAGGKAEFTGMPMSNRLKVLDVQLFSVGIIEPTDAGFQVYEKETDTTYRRIVVRDGRIVGAAFFGNTDAASAVQAAVEQKIQLDTREDLRALLV